MEGRRRVLDDMASDLSWSDLASDIMSESGTASSHQLIALHQLVQGRLVSEPALRARVVSKLCADGEVQHAAQDAEDAALGILVDIAVGLPAGAWLPSASRAPREAARRGASCSLSVARAPRGRPRRCRPCGVGAARGARGDACSGRYACCRRRSGGCGGTP